MRYLAILAILLSCTVAQAQPRQAPLDREAEETARAFRDALERAMRLMDNVLGSIPQYEMPEVMPNGDIIIRRIPSHKPEPPTRRPAPEPDRKPAPNAPKLEET